MKDRQPGEFTCRTCGGHSLSIIHVWSILAGSESETWQEWGSLEADHLWHYIYKEKIEKNEDENDGFELSDFGMLAEDDSDSDPEEYEIFEKESDPESDEFYVNGAGRDREIEFGWSEPDQSGRIFPVECSDFVPGNCWPEPRHWDSWQQKHWLRTGEGLP